MLQRLKIKNIALIDEADIPFESGLNILSGETGAGKSIIIESISLILGSRATADLVRSGFDEATVEGLFDVTLLPWVGERLREFGYPEEDGSLLVKRVVSRVGKHRIYVNGELATLSHLQKICEGLVDLCGQHEHQSLLRSNVQLELIDQYGKLKKERAKYVESYAQYSALLSERSQEPLAEGERIKKLDYLRYQASELESLGLESGEEETLQQTKTLLQSANARLKSSDSIRSALDSEDGGAMPALKTALSKWRTLAAQDPSALELSERFERAVAEIEEISFEFNRYASQIELDPEQLERVMDRISKLAELKRKYQCSADELVNEANRLREEIHAIEHQEERLAELEKLLTQAIDATLKNGRILSKKRREISESLAAAVSQELKELRMADTEIQFAIEPKSEPENWNPNGIDQIQFLVRTNSGDEMKPIAKIASGGELSRILLAIRRVISHQGGIGVYLFDEIDAGIGGQTAFMVGRKLRSVSEHHQVICITHLPQVAAFAHHHLLVAKEKKSGRTTTSVTVLSQKDRPEEVARMLGGEAISKQAMDSARELIREAGKPLS